MTDKTKFNYYVDDADQTWRHSNRFETLKEAEENARERTHREGQSMGIFKMVHKTKVPEIVKNIEIEQVQ